MDSAFGFLRIGSVSFSFKDRTTEFLLARIMSFLGARECCAFQDWISLVFRRILIDFSEDLVGFFKDLDALDFGLQIGLYQDLDLLSFQQYKDGQKSPQGETYSSK